MNILDGIKNFLQLVNDNWVTIIVIIGLVLGIYKKAKDYFKKSDEEKIEIAKKQISQIILKKISDAEKDYEEWNKAGSIKRSQVIEQIYRDYPILEKVMSQDELIAWIDAEIDNALPTLREIVSNNKVTTENS